MRSKETVSDIAIGQGKDQGKSNIRGAAGGETQKAAQRDKRAQNLAAMGLVTRDGSRYSVKTATFRGREERYEVWRDDKGRVRCTCAEFTELSEERPTFRCEHILAVKYFLTLKAPDADSEAKPDGRENPARPTPQITDMEKTRRENIPVIPEIAARAPQAAAPEQNSGEKKQEKNQLESNPDTTHTSKSHPFEIDMPESYPPEIYAPEFYTPEFYTEEYEMNGKEKEVAQTAQIEAGANQAPGPQPAQVVPLPFANLTRALRQPIDPRLIKTREGWTDRQGNAHWVEYIEWHTAADILDRVAPDWSHAVRNITQLGEIVAVTASITINGVTREGVGTGSAENETGIKKAEHDALKRAAVKFGIARDLYRRESDVIEEDGIAPSIARDPRPKTLGDLVTPKQLWMIRNLGREAGCDVEQDCQALMQCKLEEISKRAASSFIDYLQRRQQEAPPEEFQRAS
jgi:hypothetical protein